MGISEEWLFVVWDCFRTVSANLDGEGIPDLSEIPIILETGRVSVEENESVIFQTIRVGVCDIIRAGARHIEIEFESVI